MGLFERREYGVNQDTEGAMERVVDSLLHEEEEGALCGCLVENCDKSKSMVRSRFIETMESLAVRTSYMIIALMTLRGNG